MADNTNASSPVATPATAPSDDNLKSIAGAFIAIKSANQGIALMPVLPKITDDKGQEIPGLEKTTLDNALKNAQSHVDSWNKDVSKNVQKQLQFIVSHKDLMEGFVPEIDPKIKELIQNNKQGHIDTDLLRDLLDYYQALQQSVKDTLYGAGGTAELPMEDSVLGAYNQLTNYQKNVIADHAEFSKIHDTATNEETGLKANVELKKSSKQALEKAISSDETLIATGAVVAVTGILVVVVGVALIPETGPVGVGVAITGGVMVAGGLGGGAYALIDMNNKKDEVAKLLKEIQKSETALASITSLAKDVQDLTSYTDVVYRNLGVIITNWQQMDNFIEQTIKGLNLPMNQLTKWIGDENGGNGKLLQIETNVAAKQWTKAGDLAQNLLNGLANIREITLPDGMSITKENVENQLAA